MLFSLKTFLSLYNTMKFKFIEPQYKTIKGFFVRVLSFQNISIIIGAVYIYFSAILNQDVFEKKINLTNYFFLLDRGNDILAPKMHD